MESDSPPPAVHITFITTIKICKNYEWLIDSMVLYARNIDFYARKYDMTYEILICEQVDDRNVCRIGDKVDLRRYGNVTVIELDQTYPNPHGYNMIESYGKNACLALASGKFTCMTSADQVFSEEFFAFVSQHLKEGVFYRFATYEFPVSDIPFASIGVDHVLAICHSSRTRLCNGGCFDHPDRLNWLYLGEKSGDVMLLDTASFEYIKGWPESPYFGHMDTVVCIVATNNFPAFVPDKTVCTYTAEQKKRSGESHERQAWKFALQFADEKRKFCN